MQPTFRALLLVSLCFCLSYAATNVLIKGKEFASCPCDLISGGCDQFCCCDSDCATNLVTYWTQQGTCKSVTNALKSKSCISRSELYTWNTRKGVKVTEEGDQICFEVDNPDTAYSFSFIGANKFMDFLGLDSSEIARTLSGIQSFRNAFDSSLIGAMTYSYGDTILSLDPNTGDVVPAMFGRVDPATGLCGKGVGPIFLQPETSECYVMPASDLSTLDANVYNRIIKQGLNSYSYKDVRTILSSSGYGSPSYDPNTKVLKNAVSGVEYKVYLSDELTISSVSISLEVIDSVTLTDGLFKQRFKVGFYGKSTSQRSGNPGYATGSNLLLKSNQQLVSSLTGITTQGTCQVSGDTTSSISIPLTYGSDLQIRCNIPKDRLTEYCKNPAILKSINDLTHVGIFGNSNLAQSDDWVTIVNARNVGTTPENFPAEINIEVLTSQMGKPRQFQKYVVGMRVTFTQRSIVNDKVPIQVVNVVYKEVLPKLVEDQREKLRRKPFYDLFYPLVQQDSYGESGVSVVFALVAFVLLILF